MGSKRNEIRKDMLAVMSSLDDRWLRAASSEMCKNLSRLLREEYKDRLSFILAWTSFFRGEADLTQFISHELDTRAVYLPRSLPDRTMSFVAVGRNWGEVVEAGYYGIPEPGAISGELYQPSHSHKTAVIVPGVAFDRQGNRLGRGKGYYDRFLSHSEMRDAIKVGVCWSLQLVDEIPAQPHDVPVDWICTEHEYFRCAESAD